MFLILLLIICIGVGAVILWLGQDASGYDQGPYTFFGTAFIILGIVGFIIVAGVGYTMQRTDVEDLSALRDDLEVAQRRAAELQPIVEDQLIERFPDLQAEIIANIDEPEILLTYPDLAEAGRSIREGVDRLISFREAVYSIENQVIDLEAELRVRDANPWYVHFPGWPTWDADGPEDGVHDGPLTTTTTPTTSVPG